MDNCQDFYTMSTGLSSEDVDYQQDLYGRNSLSIEMKPIYKLVLHEVSSLTTSQGAKELYLLA